MSLNSWVVLLSLTKSFFFFFHLELYLQNAKDGVVLDGSLHIQVPLIDSLDCLLMPLPIHTWTCILRISILLYEQVLIRYYPRIIVRTRERHLVVPRQFSHTQILQAIVETSAMQIARVRTPNRLNLVVYVQHSRGIISSDADLCTKRPGFLSRLLLNPGVCEF